MQTTRALFSGIALLLLTSCGYFSENQQQQAEQALLAKDEQVAAAIALIREKGLDAVVASAEAGTTAACIASRLAQDPMGKLITVEGALAESSRIADLLADIEKLMQTEPSLEQMAGLLHQGAAAARYASELVKAQGVEGALTTLKTMASAKLGEQGLGEHLQLVLATCKNYEVPKDTSKEQAASQT